MFRRVQTGIEAEAEGSEDDGDLGTTLHSFTGSRLQALIQNSNIKPFKGE